MSIGSSLYRLVVLAALLSACTLPAAQSPALPPEMGPVAVQRGIAYTQVAGKNLYLDAYLPAKNATGASVIAIHGGGWAGGDRADFAGFCAGLARYRLACFSIQYRLVPQAHYPAQLEDAQAAVRFVRANATRFGIDPTRIGALGASAGGHLVELLGTAPALPEQNPALQSISSQVRAVVAFFAPSDLTATFPRTPYDVNLAIENLIGQPLSNLQAYRVASPIYWVSAHSAPHLLLHGASDLLVPVEQSQRFAKALEENGVPVQLEVFPGEGHGFSDAAIQKAFFLTLDFFKRQLERR